MRVVRFSQKKGKFIPVPRHELGDSDPGKLVRIQPCIIKDIVALYEQQKALGLFIRELIPHNGKRWWKTVDYFYDVLVAKGWNCLLRRLTSVVNRQHRVLNWESQSL